MHEYLDDKNFIQYCAKYYDNPQGVSDLEFLEDVSRIKYIKKLCTKYETSGDLKERLILNHLITLNNLFGPIATPRILFLKMQKQFHLLKPFLIAMSIMPDRIYNVRKKNSIVYTDEIPLDQRIVGELRKALIGTARYTD